MKYKYLSAHKIIGVTWPAAQSEGVSIEYPDSRACALITPTLDDCLFELDRKTAAFQILVSRMGGRERQGTVEAQVAHALEELRERRDQEFGKGVFIVLEADGEVDTWNPTHSKETDDYVWVYEGASETEIRQKYQALVNDILASFFVGSDLVDGVKKVADGVYFINDEGKPVYSMSLMEGVNATVSSALDLDAIDYVRTASAELATQDDLIKPIGLLTSSLDSESDDLRSFLSVWTSLEMFVNKIFSQYKPQFFDWIDKPSDEEKPRRFAERIREVKNGKYSLLDRYAVAAYILARRDAEDDIASFKIVKDIRDGLVHRGGVTSDPLPIADTRHLFRKIVRLHLARVQE